MDEMKDGQRIVSTGKTTCACGPGCSCGCGHHCIHRLIWWVVGIFILLIVFAMGMKAGEFKDELRGLYGGGYYRSYPMMQRTYNGGGVAVPATGGATGTTGNAPMIPVQQ